MAKNSKTKKGGKKSILSAVKGKKGTKGPKGKGSIIDTVKGAVGFGGKGTGKKHHKKSALWYAREIARLKLKKRYEKQRIGV